MIERMEMLFSDNSTVSWHKGFRHLAQGQKKDVHSGLGFICHRPINMGPAHREIALKF